MHCSLGGLNMGTVMALMTGPQFSNFKKNVIFNHGLSGCSDEKEEEEYEKEEVGEDGEIILVSGDKVSGPWNKSGAAPAPAAAPVGE